MNVDKLHHIPRTYMADEEILADAGASCFYLNPNQQHGLVVFDLKYA